MYVDVHDKGMFSLNLDVVLQKCTEMKHVLLVLQLCSSIKESSEKQENW